MSSPPPLSSFRVRPRFTERVGLSRDTVRKKIVASLTAHAPGLEVRPFHEFIGVHVAAKDRRYWSPRLFLSLELEPDGTTRIEGIYGPEIEIWSVFLYGYLITGLLGTLSSIFGGAQLYIGAQPWGFWIAGSMAFIAATLYLAAQLGQKLAVGQTFQIHQAYQAAIAPEPGPA